MIIIYIVGLILFVSFLMIVFRGAPYVPTKAHDVAELLDFMKIGNDEVLVDLGSGDGKVLLAAAAQGIRSVGYELNPFLVLVSWWRLRRVRAYAQAKFADFWLTQLPANTRVVFVFLGTPYMKRLDSKLAQEASRVGHTIRLVSYGVPIAGRDTVAERGALLAYDYQP